jgi:hypothetical protein
MRRWLVACAAVAVSASACTSTAETGLDDDEVEVVPSTFPVENRRSHRSLELAFDGAECIYDGPANLSSGPIEISFENLTDGRAWVHLVRLDGDRTVEDFKDWFDTIPGGGLPGWTFLVWYGGEGLEVEGGVFVAGEVEVFPGAYGMVCGSVNPDLGYFASGLVVED